MKKIVINPNNCHRDEYQELIDYLNGKEWSIRFLDENEVIKTSQKVEEISTNKTTKLCAHTIEYWFNDHPDRLTTVEDEEHIERYLIEGYYEGELNSGEEEIRGWWKIRR